jgi:hypothetical protein
MKLFIDEENTFVSGWSARTLNIFFLSVGILIFANLTVREWGLFTHISGIRTETRAPVPEAPMGHTQVHRASPVQSQGESS